MMMNYDNILKTCAGVLIAGTIMFLVIAYIAN